VTTVTIYGQWAKYDPDTKRVDHSLDQFDVELREDEDWKAPLGFNVTVVRVK
jgi:hypothetical protein